MKVVLGSIFRDSETQLPQYFRQVELLADLLHAYDMSFRVIWVEGDSTDRTWPLLKDEIDNLMGLGLIHAGRLVRHAHGGAKYGSVDQIARWNQVAPVCNKALDQIEDEDVVVYIESDLLWEPATIFGLLQNVAAGIVDALSPMVWTRFGQFYDIYAFRVNGKRFSPLPPYHESLESTARFFPMESTGSCIVMRGEVARQCRFDEDTCLLGKSIEAHGYQLWLDREASIWHP